jgi:hypothetical protein
MAAKLGINVEDQPGYWRGHAHVPILEDISAYLPEATNGEDWTGCA